MRPITSITKDIYFKLILTLLFTFSLLHADPTRIMPLGDSITKGYIVDEPAIESGYRGPLWSKLLEDGYRFDFIGETSSGEEYNTSFDADHNGYNGFTISNINNRVDNYLVLKNPDIILLHIGTNDFKNGANPNLNTVTNHVKSILDKIYAYNPNITILLARILDFKSHNPQITLFNDTVVSMANTHPANIHIVDMQNAAGFNYAIDMENQLHPNNMGYTKMANLWHKTLQSVMPIHFWKLEEASRSSIYLDSARDAHGTCLENQCPTRVTGKKAFGQAFDGIKTKLTVNDTEHFNWAVDANVSISFWMKTNPSASNLYEVMIGRKGLGAGDDRWYIGVKRDSGVVTYGLANADGEQDQGTGSSIVGDGNWHHITYVISAERIKVYVDGEIDVNKSRNNSLGAHVQGTAVSIGYLDQGNQFEFTGVLDEIALYNTALSAEQVRQNYGALEIVSTPITFLELNEIYFYDVNSNKDPVEGFVLNNPTPNWLSLSNPDIGIMTGKADTIGNFNVQVEARNSTETATQDYVLKVRNTSNLPNNMTNYWKLDESEGSPYIDMYSGYDGTCDGENCPSATAGKINGSQEFDGSDDRVDVTQTEAFDWSEDANITIAFWMNSDQVPSSGNDVMIGRKGQKASTAQDIWFIGRDSGTGNLTYGLSNREGNLTWGVLNVNVTDGNWNHIAYVITQDTLKVYVNGEEKLNKLRGKSVGEHIQGTHVNIGYLDWGNRFEYNGLLDEIVVFNRALTNAEINAHIEDANLGNGFEYPELTEVTDIPTVSNETVLSYTFSTNKVSTISYGGSCGVPEVTSTIIGENTIIYNALEDGTYTDCTITVTDATGNTFTHTIPTFSIDTTPVILTLNEADTIHILHGGLFTDPGASATEDAEISLSGSVDTSTIDSYILTYTAMDTLGNSTVKTRTVHVNPSTWHTFESDDTLHTYVITLGDSIIEIDKVLGKFDIIESSDSLTFSKDCQYVRINLVGEIVTGYDSSCSTAIEGTTSENAFGHGTKVMVQADGSFIIETSLLEDLILGEK